jgi:hypothetical protein
MSFLDRIFGKGPPRQSSSSASPIDSKSPPVQTGEGSPSAGASQPALAPAPASGKPLNQHSSAASASDAKNGLSQKDLQIQQALQRLQNEIKAHPDPLLPLVSAAIKETPLGRMIVWCFAREYGVSLNIQAAELVMNQVLKPCGIVVSGHSYMGGPGERNQLFSYRAITATSLELETEVK